MELSPLQQARTAYQPILPALFRELTSLTFVEDPLTGTQLPVGEKLQKIFPQIAGEPLLRLQQLPGGSKQQPPAPLRVGVVLSGGQAPGGHNVVCALYDALLALHPESRLFGFLGGPGGIIAVPARIQELTSERLAPYRNQGGFDLIGSGRTKIHTKEQFAIAADQMRSLQLDGLVVVGGDDSNTNAAFLAEYFKEQRIATAVVGVPKTIDGDLKNQYIEVSFGFDSAARCYAETIGNIFRDALSAKKYYYFIRIMGRTASHLALECALQTHPNLTLISEEFLKNGWGLSEAVDQIVQLVVERAAAGKNFGTILLPEGLIEFFSDVRSLIAELNSLLQEVGTPPTTDEACHKLVDKLSPHSQACFSQLPEAVRRQLLLERDSHGNVQVSKIETERLLIEMVEERLTKEKSAGRYSGSFAAQPQFCGYEGRSGLPTNFDCNYCSALGTLAALLVHARKSGYLCAIQGMIQPPTDWQPCAVPLAQMCHLETRGSQQVAVIAKALVDLAGGPFQRFAEQRDSWRHLDNYLCPGPTQFFGEALLTSQPPITLQLEHLG